MSGEAQLYIPSTAASEPGKHRRKPGKARGRQASIEALEQISALLGDSPRNRDLLIEHLHKVQDHHGHLSDDHIVALAELMKLSPAEVYEVATFYHHFDVVKQGEQAPAEITVRVCDSMSCQILGAEALALELTEKYASGDVRIQKVPCVGRCEQAPVAVVGKRAVAQADVGKVAELVDSKATEPLDCSDAVGFAQYCAEGGYALWQAVRNGEKTADAVIAELEHSGLRGLGGAGFPAGRKWRILQEQPAPRLLAVNIDEGEPGTFKDRTYLEQDPHRLLEGILVAMECIGIAKAYIYLRDEYPHIDLLLKQALADLYANFENVPEIELRRGAGAYICGEESAMIESIEGKRGMPRLRPPFVAQVGLFGRPTLEHNMETLFWVRDIASKGGEWFASHGRNERKGLRSFSVSGRVKSPGMKLAPAGITLRELIDEYCDGMADGHELYGYFPGGASGGMLPASLADIPLDFDTLQPYGCFIGSAAVMVFSQQDSAKDLALNAMRFFQHESCGQCTPCRVGTAKAAALMAKPQWDKELLDDLAQVMVDASICGLGQAAPNPMKSVFKYFPEELK